MQQDLFEVPGGEGSQNSRKLLSLDRLHLTLRFDQLIFVLIGMVVLYAFVFSFGVEKGKLWAMREIGSSVREARVAPSGTDSVKIPDPVARAGTEAAVPAVSPEAVPSIRLETSSSGGAAVVEKDSPETPTAGLQGRYTIQLVTYKSENIARKQMDKLGRRGYNPILIPSGSYQQVCLNAFETRKQALSFLKKLQGEGTAPSDAYVRNIPSQFRLT